MSAYSYVQESLVFYLNGRRVEVAGEDVDPRATLAEYIRSQGLTGTKIGCAEGGCGACTVMISHYDRAASAVVHRSVASCLLPLPYVDHMLVTTVEGVASKLGQGHPIQENLAKKHGTQCGFCSPGIVMSMYSTAHRKPHLSMYDVEECLDGNLCRCTGYRAILEAAHAIAEDYDPGQDGKLSQEASKTISCAREAVQATVVFPEELKEAPKPLRLVSKAGSWFRPVSLSELLDLKAAVPSAQVLGGKHSFPEIEASGSARTPDVPRRGAQLVSGNTELGYHERYHPSPPGSFAAFVSTASVAELRAIEVTERGIRVGVATTINGLIRVCEDEAHKGLPSAEGYRAVVNILRVFANNQVRDMGTLGGSLVTADPLSDLYPALVSLGSSIKLVSKKAEREMLLDEFVTGENETQLRSDEIVLSVFVPATRQREYAETFKESKRRVDAQSAVNAGMRVLLNADNTVAEMTIAIGALGPRAAYRCKKTEAAIAGKPWTEEMIMHATAILKEELSSVVVKARGAASYRVTVGCSLLYKFFAAVCHRSGVSACKSLCSAVPETRHVLHTSHQKYEDPVPGSKVGAPVPHLAADLHVRGSARFVADLPEPTGCLHAVYALTKKAHAKLLRVDVSEALKSPGVYGVYTAKDIPSQRKLGTLVLDEEFIAGDEVVYWGQPGAVVVATTHKAARAGAAKVVFEYEDLPSVLTIEEAVAKSSYLEPEHDWKLLVRGDPDGALSRAQHVIEGEVRVGGQEHFYIEPQAALVIPGDTYMIHVTSQNPTRMQKAVAMVLGLPMNRVESRMERIGGGFGGKQDRPQFLAAATALAAHCSGRPVKMVLERDDDMQVTGQRHEFLGKYKVAFNDSGRIEAAQLELLANGGCSVDLTPAVVEVAMFAIDNCYKFDNIRIRGIPCRTNRVSCTAYRGFGKPQAMVITETIIDHVARAAGLSTLQVREANILRKGDSIIDGTVVEDQFSQCWTPLKEMFERKIVAVDTFNKENKWRKRGLALLPSRNNIGFEADCLNQAGALIHVYMDGSVFVTHGGSEMGQGLHTKLAQIAADALGCPFERIHVSASSTDRVPNTTATAASTGSDLNGSAVANAAKQLRERLDKLIEQFPDLKGKPWEALVSRAYGERVQLSASGFHCFEKYTFNWQQHKGRSSLYNIWGAALAEVELDVLTGQWRAHTIDVVQDCGHSLNPAIDVGQVEGGLAQGIGLYTIEELMWARDGHMRTRNVSTYKIPTHDDIPECINVTLLSGSRSVGGVCGNKSPSEVGVQLSASVLFALKEAVYAAREELSQSREFFRLDTPATVEKIRMACPTPFNAKI
eukprot:m51a1_g5591 xanthine dehydrogenase/oxidase, putative (1321) ;mRNA; f:649854-654584